MHSIYILERNLHHEHLPISINEPLYLLKFNYRDVPEFVILILDY